jgi:hypothetical protein
MVHRLDGLRRLLAGMVLLAGACAPVTATPVATAGVTFTPAPLLPSVTPPPPTPTSQPVATSTPILLPSPTVEPEITLLFTGDINPARCVYQIAKDAGDMTLPYQALADVLQKPDLRSRTSTRPARAPSSTATCWPLLRPFRA